MPLSLALYLVTVMCIGLSALFSTNVFLAVAVVLLAFVLPGYSVTTGIFRKMLEPMERLVLGISVSSLLTALLAYILFFRLGFALTHYAALFALLTENTVLVLLQLLFAKGADEIISYHRITVQGLLVQVRLKWALVAIAILFLVIRYAHYLAYPYLPEADSYPLVLVIRQALDSHSVSLQSYRPFFSQLLTIACSASNMEPTVLFRLIVSPILIVTALIPALIIKRVKENQRIQFLAGSITLAVPVLALEIDYVRPQTMAILLSFTVIWAIWLWNVTKDNKFLVLSFVLSAGGILFHQFAFFILFFCFVAAFPLYARCVRTHAKNTLLASLIFVIAIYPYLSEPLGSLRPLFAIFVRDISNLTRSLHFNPWFIDNYSNIDGINLGWPRWQAILYYGYNLGLAIPLLLIASVQRKNKMKKPLDALAAMGMQFGLLPLLFSEVLPRFGIFYYPDRMWLFLSIALIFIVLPVLTKIPRAPQTLLAVSVSVTVIIGVLVTYYKQGWITDSEYETAVWIKSNTPPDSLIYTQQNSIPPYQVYAKRFIADGSALISTGISTSPDEIYAQQASALKTDTENKYDLLQKKLSETNANAISGNQHEADIALQGYLSSYLKSHHAYEDRLKSIETEKFSARYIVYSKDKFNGLYGSRAWWKTSNLYGADLSFLSNTDKYELVFKAEGTSVWKILK